MSNECTDCLDEARYQTEIGRLNARVQELLAVRENNAMEIAELEEKLTAANKRISELEKSV